MSAEFVPQPEQDMVKAELFQTPEYWELREVIKAEYLRRASVLATALESMGARKEKVALAPPVPDRSDLGHANSLDGVFFGSPEELLSFVEVAASAGISAVWPCYDEARLQELAKTLPVFHRMLLERRGVFPARVPAVEDDGGYSEHEEDIEDRMRSFLSPDARRALRDRRLALGRQLLKEIADVLPIPILSSAFSGSMMNEDLDHFGINSDLDIDIVIDADVSDPSIRQRIQDTRLWLVWKYAEEKGIHVDVVFESKTDVLKAVQESPHLLDLYIRKFGSEFSQKLGMDHEK